MAVLTARLRLEPMAARHVDDLLVLYQDPAVAEWYGEWTREGIEREVARMAERWAADGVHKWMAYDRMNGECVGRGGLSRAMVDGRDCLEVGWVLHRRFWGRGYATEIGRAGLDFAFGELGAREVVAFTEPANVRSRAVMERLNMSYSKEILIEGERFALYTLTGPDR
jgi:ribosomal-protein-alanine N-acetyltransferase